MDFEALRVDGYPIDSELRDVGAVGPELAYLADSYTSTPRALIWRNPSSDWQLLVLLLPLASRLSLMSNPIFGQLTRDWGLNVRFIGVDAGRRVHDFRDLLTDATLRNLVSTLAQGDRGVAISAPDTLDVLFAALAQNMLTIVERRRRDWARHLARTHRLEGGDDASLFDRTSRFPEFVAALRQALREDVIDVDFYSRVLRSVDLREAAVETRIGAIIEATLDPTVLRRLARSRVGKHLGCYNWLLLDPRRRAARAYALERLPAFAQFFADALIDVDPATDTEPEADIGDLAPDREPEFDPARTRGASRPIAPPPRAPADRDGDGSDLRRIASGAPTEPGASAQWLRQAIDSGQDRWIIESIARRFAVSDNVIRALWRSCPSALGAPPTWHLRQILLQLNELPERAWPRGRNDWLELMSRAVPSVAR